LVVPDRYQKVRSTIYFTSPKVNTDGMKITQGLGF
jgi:hypothetical protein